MSEEFEINEEEEELSDEEILRGEHPDADEIDFSDSDDLDDE